MKRGEERGGEERARKVEWRRVRECVRGWVGWVGCFMEV